jgi:nicotinate-nucleotide pyrophosphorylase (carboxylating)
MELPAFALDRIVEAALAEDLPWGDLTTDNLIPAGVTARAEAVAKASGVIAGLPVFERVFARLDPQVKVTACCRDGSPVRPGQVVAAVEGPARSLLRGERVALNFLQRLSGIATLTSQYVAAVAGLPCRIIDTRKTTPGLRLLEKYAVRMGGGANHRFGLSDGILIKDNHLAVLRREGIPLASALAELRRRIPHGVRIQVEVENLEEVREALAAGADALLFDNMSPELLREAVALARGRAITEASGGITLETVRTVAETGVDLISVGALTHSARALDISLDFRV